MVHCSIVQAVATRGIVFLDCDGALCNARSQLYDFDKNDDSLVHHHPDIFPLEKRCIAALRRVAQATSAKALLTTLRLIPENRSTFPGSVVRAKIIVGI